MSIIQFADVENDAFFLEITLGVCWFYDGILKIRLSDKLDITGIEVMITSKLRSIPRSKSTREVNIILNVGTDIGMILSKK